MPGQLVPRVGLDLLQAERDRRAPRVDAEHHRIDLVADVEDLARCLTRLLHDISRDVDRPSTPGSSSMNAP